jgi:hypothetical protein
MEKMEKMNQMQKMENYPGMTRYIEVSKDITMKFTNIEEKKNIFLATAAIGEDTLFINGLYQNVYLLYRMFEAMGYFPFLFVNKKLDPNQKVPKFMQDVRVMQVEEFAQRPFQISYYIEIGMSVEEKVRKFLKMCGAKICKLYLGNILNIDIETPIFYPHMHFAHHVIGELDAIWVSPHYYQHAEYALAVNHVDIKRKETSVAPYVWDSQVLTNDGERKFKWRQAKNAEEDTFLILEPNISFQKTSLIPLMMVEAWYRENKGWRGQVVLVNGDRLLANEFFRETIWKTLELVKDDRIVMKPRMDILTLLTTYPSAIPICHQWNNEYNYMVLEYFHCDYPVIHNASDWKEYGYYYSNSSIEEGVKRIKQIRKEHTMNIQTYKAHAKALAWRHSPYNPVLHKGWEKLLESTKG